MKFFNVIGILTLAAWAPAADFDKDIRPLLQKHCIECHGGKKQKADLRLDAKAFAFKGGESGSAIQPRDSQNSPLFLRIATKDDSERMPPKGEALSEKEITMVKAWIDEGAVWPESAADRAATVDRRLQHWAFQPLPASPKGSVDAFIKSALGKAALRMSPEADRRTLIRRAYFDVTGLPPSPEEVEAFATSKDPHAYEKLIDRLLASPRFGERWARHWLDVVRFAESDGFEKNNMRANAWPYRDYVIQAFNEDKPYDQFVREQIAGDAFSMDAATGFLVGGANDTVKSKDPVLTANQRADELHDMVSTTAATFLGVTLNCARCHDHKFDPIPSKDYYGFVAMLQGVKHGERPMRTADSAEQEKRLQELRKELGSIENALSEFKPRASFQRVILIDDSSAPAAGAKPGATQIEQPTSGKPIAYSTGREKGAADDPGDVSRLPNLGESYRYWTAQPGRQDDFFAWEPKLDGRWRIWVSWGAWTTHTKDARYVIDLDGDLATTNDQKVIATVNQREFADGSPAVPGERRWSGFRSTGLHDLNPKSIVVLRGGDSGGPTVADVMAFEEAGDANTDPSSPALRLPVTHLANEEIIEPVEAKLLRFTITATSGLEPCIDELEVFTPGDASENVAMGAQVKVSGTYANGANAKHQFRHLNDGRYGNDASWISNEPGKGWAQLEFSKPERIHRIVWSRDRSMGKGRVYEDRRATGYRIEVSMDGEKWQTVASSADRLGEAYRQRVTSLPTLSSVPPGQAGAVSSLNEKRSRLLTELQQLATQSIVYAGRFDSPGPTHRMHRGDPMLPREEVPPAALSLIGKSLVLGPGTAEQERRLALANWITDPANPLTARVIVNRLWHYHFGTGIVDTPSDFGLNGSRPTHPELLDYLANELITHRWSLKHIHRLILLSKTFKQSSAMHQTAFQVDSNARLLWRFPPRRLEAEAIRDSILAASGQLDLRMGGPGFDLFEPNDNYVKVYTTKAEYGPAEFRRMVYQSKPRTMLDDFFGAFDCPDAGQPQPKRTVSTTPLQALNLLNSSFALQQAGFLAQRVQKEAGTPGGQIVRAFQLLFNRAPAVEEQAEAEAFARTHGLPALCRALYNSNEFIRLN